MRVGDILEDFEEREGPYQGIKESQPTTPPQLLKLPHLPSYHPTFALIVNSLIYIYTKKPASLNGKYFIFCLIE